jgi:hypothetical protein
MYLRPLSLGEQMDRAVTLCVRNAVLLALIYLAFGVVAGVLKAYGSNDEAKIVGGMIDLIRSHEGKAVTSKELANVLHPQSALNGFTAAWWGVTVFVAPLMQAALMFAASSLYIGKGVTFGSAYVRGLRSWLPFIGVGTLYCAVGGVIYVIVLIAGIAGALAVGLLWEASHPFGVFLGVFAAVAGMLIVLTLGVLLWFSLNISFFACVVERIGFMHSFVRGLQLVFSSVGLRRSLVAALALGAVSCGIAVVGILGAGMIYGILRSNVVAIVFTTLLQLVGVGFTTMFFAVFYYDMRVRREAFDLQQEIAQAPMTPS